MILISHRGNLNGPNPSRENSLSYIQEALDSGYDVEVDVWAKVKSDEVQWFYGHDEPQYLVEGLLHKFPHDKIWYHAKNLDAALWLTWWKHKHVFWHQTDDYTLTTSGWIWTYPGRPLRDKRMVCVLPERFGIQKDDVYGAICSDYIAEYR